MGTAGVAVIEHRRHDFDRSRRLGRDKAYADRRVNCPHEFRSDDEVETARRFDDRRTGEDTRSERHGDEPRRLALGNQDAVRAIGNRNLVPSRKQTELA
jgi:hypothetical protein